MLEHGEWVGFLYPLVWKEDEDDSDFYLGKPKQMASHH